MPFHHRPSFHRDFILIPGETDAAFVLLIQWPAQAGDAYPIAYTAVVALVSALCVYLLKGQSVLQPHRHIGPGVVVGTLGIACWIGLAHSGLDAILIAWLPELVQPAPRPAFNPFAAINNPHAQWGFIAVRLLGIGILVPVIEEIFWRGFLWRYVSSRNWQDEPLGRFQLSSFVWVTLLFTLAHPEWLSALVWCIMVNLLYCWRKNLWDCIVAHGVSNALLAAYVLTSGQWHLW